MMEDRILVGILSLLGYGIMQAGYIPQLYNLYKIKKSDQLSLKWIGAVNTALWFMSPLVYLEAPIEMQIGHTVGVIVNSILIIQVWYYRRK